MTFLSHFSPQHLKASKTSKQKCDYFVTSPKMLTNPYQGIAMYPEGPSVDTASTARYLLREADKMATAPFQSIRMSDFYSLGGRAATGPTSIGYEPATRKSSSMGTYDVLGRESTSFGHLRGIDVSAALTRMAATIDYSARR